MRPAPALWRPRAATCCTAFCVLSYEIALTRVFSVLFRSPYVFLILSIAVCGLGLGACLAARPAPRDEAVALGRPARALAILLAAPMVILLTIGTPLVAQANGVAVAVLTLCPYVAAGLLLARVFERYADDAGRLYFYDLGGAGLAALATLPLLARVGGIALPLLLAGLAGLAALVVSWPSIRSRAGGVALAVALLALFAGQQSRPFLRLPPVTSSDPLKVKPLFQELADPRVGGRILYTKWSAVARTDVESNAGTDTLYIWTDGDVPTQMEPFDGDLAKAAEYRGFIGYLPYQLQPSPERVLCIGPGGGLDVLLAILGGARTIEPVELNPAIVDVTERFKGFYGDLYHRPEVKPGLITDEGRSYLSRSPRRYDLIYFALAKTATTQQGGMALVDNYLYTVEAFDAYFDHLAAGGLLALILQEPHLTDRCLVTAVASLLKGGLSPPEAAARIAWLTLPPERAVGPYRQLLLIRNGALDQGLLGRLRQAGERTGLVPVLVPGFRWPAPYTELLRDGATAESFTAAVASQDRYLTRPYRGAPVEQLDFSVVTDDRPFYADFSRGLHPFLRSLLVWSLLLGALTAAGAVLAARRQVDLPAGPAAAAVAYFALLGLGFLLVEVALVQKLVLIVGYPTLSLSVILFSLLVGAALGGRMANRGDSGQAARRLAPVLAALVVLLAAVSVVVPLVTGALLPRPLWQRSAAVVLATLPLGFLMGQPFPTGLRRLGVRWSALVPLAWAVNGVLSVTGSVMAAAVASQMGYRAVLWTGAVVYALVGVAGAGWLGSVGEIAGREAADGGTDPGR